MAAVKVSLRPLNLCLFLQYRQKDPKPVLGEFNPDGVLMPASLMTLFQVTLNVSSHLERMLSHQ